MNEYCCRDIRESVKAKLLRRAGRALSALTLIAAVALSCYIMARGLGLDDSLDFGAGAYYYADMPGFEKFIDKTYYVSKTPMWALILLFLTWGAFMYYIWLALDKQSKGNAS